MRFLGHVMRLDDSRLLKKTFLAYVHGGDLAIPGSLLQDCENIPFNDLIRLAEDRSGWQKKVNALS